MTQLKAEAAGPLSVGSPKLLHWLHCFEVSPGEETDVQPNLGLHYLSPHPTLRKAILPSWLDRDGESMSCAGSWFNSDHSRMDESQGKLQGEFKNGCVELSKHWRGWR